MNTSFNKRTKPEINKTEIKGKEKVKYSLYNEYYLGPKKRK